MIEEGVEDWVFYKFVFWKCIIIMFGGLVMNLLIVVVFYMIVFCGFGILVVSIMIGSVLVCIVSLIM